MAKSDVTKWNDAAVFDAALKKVQGNMQEAVTFCANKTREKLKRRNTPRKRVGRSGMRGLNPSAEGESPKVVTGTLRANVGTQVVTTNTKVIGRYGIKQGAADKYGRRLELGMVGKDSLGRMVNQGERPYLRPVVPENEAEIVKRVTK